MQIRAAVTAIALLPVFLIGRASPADAIVNGKEVTENDAYTHAVVGVVPLDKDGLPGECTGILLTPRAVLTAAHCVKGMTSVSVAFDLKIGGTHKVVATRTVIHPSYSKKEDKLSPGDLAVIFLPPHDYATSIIPFDVDLSFNKGQQFVILGYGRSVARSFRSTGTLRKAQIAATGRNTTQNVGLTPLGGAWPCSGDSGGPILRKDMNGRYALTGILSGGFSGPIGECLTGSFMTPVHNYADWIAETLKAGN